MIVFDADVVGSRKAFKREFSFDYGSCIIAMMQVDIVQIAVMINKDGRVSITLMTRSSSQLSN